GPASARFSGDDGGERAPQVRRPPACSSDGQSSGGAQTRTTQPDDLAGRVNDSPDRIRPVRATDMVRPAACAAGAQAPGLPVRRAFERSENVRTYAAP